MLVVDSQAHHSTYEPKVVKVVLIVDTWLGAYLQCVVITVDREGGKEREGERKKEREGEEREGGTKEKKWKKTTKR